MTFLRYVCMSLAIIGAMHDQLSGIEIPPLEDPDAQLVRVEYYFDQDPGLGQGVEVPFSLDDNGKATLEFKPDVSPLPYGAHRLYIRALNRRGEWSLPKEHAFSYQPFGDQQTTKLVRAEYFIGEDPGKGKATPIAEAQDKRTVTTVLETGPIVANPPGSTDLILRAQDENGNWSFPYRHSFRLTPHAIQNKPAVSLLEYFIGQDPGPGNGIPAIINRADPNTIHIEIPQGNNLGEGHQSVGVRIQDSNGVWSSPLSTRYFQVPSLPATEVIWSIRDGETLAASGNHPIQPPSTDVTLAIQTDFVADPTFIEKTFTAEVQLVLVDKIHIDPVAALFSIDAIVEPVRIVQHPEAQSTFAGDSITLIANASGAPPLTYQWLKDGFDIPGATNPQLSLASLKVTDSGDYQVLVSNAAGSKSSRTALITVAPKPVLDPVQMIAHPQTITLLSGQTLELNVTATGSPPLTYQWYFGDQPVAGATSSTYTIPNAQPIHSGSYQVTVSNPVGTQTSREAQVIVEGQTINQSPHPADLNGDYQMAIHEVTAYGAAWKTSQPWSVEPIHIPIAYVTRAGALWKGGEEYEVDASKGSAPLWWVNVASALGPRSVWRPIVPVYASRSVDRMGGSWTITLDIHPNAETTAFAGTEFIPDGFAVVSTTTGGLYAPESGSIRWGPFFDPAPVSVQYTLEANEDGISLTRFSGLASFDGTNHPILGVTALDPSVENSSPASVQIESGYQLKFSGTGEQPIRIESSDTLEATNWRPYGNVKPDGSDIYWMDPRTSPVSQRFYRLNTQQPTE